MRLESVLWHCCLLCLIISSNNLLLPVDWAISPVIKLFYICILIVKKHIPEWAPFLRQKLNYYIINPKLKCSSFLHYVLTQAILKKKNLKNQINLKIVTLIFSVKLSNEYFQKNLFILLKHTGIIGPLSVTVTYISENPPTF